MIGLEASGIKKYGRNKEVAKRTGYAPGMVAKVLSGHVALTDKFIRAACKGFDIREEWIYEGIEPIRGIELGGVAAGTSQVNGDLTLPAGDVLESRKLSSGDREKILKKMRGEVEQLEESIASADSKIKELAGPLDSLWEYVQHKYPDLVVAFQRVPDGERNLVLTILKYGFNLSPE